MFSILKHTTHRLSQVSVDIDIPINEPTQGTIQQGLQIFFGILAGVAVLIITVASLYFVLSRGNPDKANRARDAIIYAAVALAIAVLASAIVRFAIGTAGP